MMIKNLRVKDMPKFEFKELSLEGAFLIENFFAYDNRGGFTKYFEKEIFAEKGISFCVSEVFSSISSKNVIRGIHFQLNNPQAKLVSAVSGAVRDVIVDLRPNSKTYKRWICEELSEKNHRSLYVPRGFGHGFVAMEDNTIMFYQCDGKYDQNSDTGIRFDDPEIGIDWQISEGLAIHSERDMRLMSFEDYARSPMKWVMEREGV